MLAHALLATAVAACGFEPMYAPRGETNPLDELAAIRIEPARNRIEQLLRNDLLERLTPFGEPANPRYRLAFDVRQSSDALAIQPDTTITRFNLRIDVAFTLIDAETGAALYRGRTRAVGSYNAVRSDFATLAAEQDTARRTVREASEEVRTLLAVFFTQDSA